MKKDKIYIGNIRRCTKYESHKTVVTSANINNECIGSSGFGYTDSEDEMYKENAILIKTKNGGYVDLDNLNNFLDYLKVKNNTTKNGIRLDGLIMSTSADYLNCLFVDEGTLKPYYKNQNSDISIIELKKIRNK